MGQLMGESVGGVREPALNGLTFRAAAVAAADDDEW